MHVIFIFFSFNIPLYARVGNLQPFARIHKSRTVHAGNVFRGLIVECRNMSTFDGAYKHTQHTHTHTLLHTYGNTDTTGTHTHTKQKHTTHKRTHIHKQTNVHIYTHNTHTHKHTHTHTHTLTPLLYNYVNSPPGSVLNSISAEFLLAGELSMADCFLLLALTFILYTDNGWRPVKEI